ncbi:MAG: HAMP domain-containing histidine kinase [Acidobacteria bacterium]|nr:HAMP domain-containing histidine kinase [Acidobacteriota bacterium]
MHTSWLRRSGVTLLAGTVLVLLPALAWLQSSWLDQIATADRERRERTLQTAAAQLAGDLDGELSRAFAGLQVESATLEHRAWSTFAQRYSAWAASAANPAIVQSVHVIELSRAEGATPHRLTASLSLDRSRVSQWNAATASFEETAWPEHLAGLRGRMQEQTAHFKVEPGQRGGRFLAPPLSLGDERTLIAPIIDLGPPSADDPPNGVPEVRLLGFTVISLDLEVVRHEVLPALVRRHFSFADGGREYRVAVVQREHPDKIVYESEEGAARAAIAEPDASATLMAPRMRPTFFMQRGERRLEPPPLPPQVASATPDNVVISVLDARRGERAAGMHMRMIATDGHWRLVAKHRAGSLEAAVASTRTRNVGLSSGILLLLAAAIGLIVVSARRAHRLARQQMEFVAAVSHELRTPVSVIGAAAGNLADGVIGDPVRVKKYGATIQGEARRLAETVERVLQLAGIAAGRAGATSAPVAPSVLVAEALAACRPDLDASGMQLDVAIAPDLPLVVGDAPALKSALQNLLANALKYGRSGGWLRIAARATSGKRAVVEFIVEDRGPGVAAADRTHIFEPFYRGRDAVAQQIHGSGLGLNLVYRIAEAHGGSVSVSSEPGHGARFTLRLPAVQEVASSVSLQANGAPTLRSHSSP